MNIVRVFRSPNLGFYSIERVFKSIKRYLSNCFFLEDYYVEKAGFSIINVLKLKMHIARCDKNSIFHITGDIHYCIFAVPRKRSILTVHDCVFINNNVGIKRFIIKKIFLDWPVRYARVITAISQKTKDEIVSLTGCSPEKIKVINNPISDDIEHVPKEINKEKPTLLFIGSTPNKNLRTVIESIKDINCYLWIIGQPSSPELSMMKHLNIDYVCEQNLSDKEIGKRYIDADIVVFPSLYEGFGLPIIEGFKAGRPVLTSNISPLKELADNAAWLVNPTDAVQMNDVLKRIIAEDEARTSKISLGLKRAEDFSSEQIAKLYINIYRSVNQQFIRV